MNAYELADQLDNVKYQNGAKPFEMYANMLRQQADRIAEFEDKLSFYEIKDLDSGLKPKPLSDEEIRKIAIQCDAYDNDGSLITDDICIDKFARAIEERHGIK